MEYLNTLNDAQKRAVLHTEGALLVLAGAGSGKTRVITHRILHLMESGVSGENILAVTFTNKAASEMRERMQKLAHTLPGGSRHLETPPTLTTFHSLGVRLLRENYARLNLRRHFTIYDRADSLSAIKQALAARGYGPKQFEPRMLLGAISRAKGDAKTRDSHQSESFFGTVVGEIWEAYESILEKEHALDFDDLLSVTWRMLKDNADIRERYQERFRYLHIDEYQDTNKVQYAIARLLAGERANICAVGDIDQNIYSWRGADLNNILQFERHFTNASVILLEENYRSTQTIIAASNDIISKNVQRVEKTVFTKNKDGEPISLYAAYNENDEASFVADKAREYITNGMKPSHIAVLFRANFQSRALEEAFLSRNVPYQMLGTRFFDRKEIKDILSYVRLLLNPESTHDLSRCINMPPRGIGKVSVLRLLEGKREEITGKARLGVEHFFTLMETLRGIFATEPLSKALRELIVKTGIEEMLREDGEEGLERLENIRELVSLATKYDHMPELEGALAFVENVTLSSDQDSLDTTEAGEGVKLMTVHAAKGLEFGVVFITGLEEGLFPHERLSDERTDEEEERRLFYVALTRAMDKVYLSYAHVRTIFGRSSVQAPSRFIADIGDGLMISENPQESGYERTIFLD